MKITSSSGRESLQFKPLLSMDHHKEGSVLLCEISGESKFWDRSDDLEFSELVDNANVCFYQSPLLIERLHKLADSLQSWLDEPHTINIQLSGSVTPVCSLFIGRTNDLICSNEKPVLKFTYSESAITTIFQFVVDQSCIKLFLEEIRLQLNRPHFS